MMKYYTLEQALRKQKENKQSLEKVGTFEPYFGMYNLVRKIFGRELKEYYFIENNKKINPYVTKQEGYYGD